MRVDEFHRESNYRNRVGCPFCGFHSKFMVVVCMSSSVERLTSFESSTYLIIRITRIQESARAKDFVHFHIER